MTKLNVKRILAAVDLGAQSEDVLTWARWFGMRFGGSVDIVHAIPLSVPSYFTESQVNILATELKKATSGLGKRVERLAKKVLQDVVFTVTVREGHALEVIRAVAQETRPDLIVAGSHGHGRLQRFLLGSVAENLYRDAHCPTLVVKSKLPQAGIQGILCPVNLSELARDCADCSKVLAEQAGADLFLLQALEHESADPEATRDRVCQWHTEGSVSQARVTELVGRGDPVEETITEAQQHSVDLIVIGARHRQLLGSFVLGRTTEYIVRLSPISVLIVPDSAAREQRDKPQAASAPVSS